MAKTDRVDAARLPTGGPVPSEPKTAFLERLEALVCRDGGPPRVAAQTASELGGLKKIAASIGKEIAELKTRSDPDFAVRYQSCAPFLASVSSDLLLDVGVGPSRTGRPPACRGRIRDSGKAQGQRHIRGGRRRPREAMYMAAQTASRWNQDMAAMYDRLIANGKRHKVAIVAIMRKLIILANVLLRDGRKWAPTAPKSVIPSCG